MITGSLSDQKVNLKMLPKSKNLNFDQHLTSDAQINLITKLNYNVLRILKTFKRFKPWNV